MTTRVRTAVVVLGLAAACAAGNAGEVKREPIGRGAQFVAKSCSCGGVARAGIFAHPPWDGARGRVVGQYALDLAGAREPVLEFRIGIADGHGSDRGVIFRVGVDGTCVWKEFHKDGVWSEVQRVPLQTWAGRRIVLELGVDSLGEHYACWGEPRITSDGALVHDLVAGAGAAVRFVDLMDALAPEDLPESLRLAERREAAAAAGVVPTRAQVAWQENEFIAFAHFGVNTFTDREWGDGTELESIFNPTAFDARQWARVCVDAGIKLLILTCKHHDGFCLWPSAYTEHSVKKSPWRAGAGDVVREVSDACRESGLGFGVYLSPWDRNQPCYGDSPRYDEYFRNQLKELLTGYGPVEEVWFDGACGEGPNGKKQVYDWASYYAVVRACQPDALIAISGPDIRWVGNESGVARETEWSVQRGAGAMHGGRPLVWWPAECDVSIRPGWFYHASEDAKVKSLEQLLDIYYKSVGRNSVLLLNLPPDRRGLIHENDAARLRELRRAIDETFRTNLLRGARSSASSASRTARAAADGDASTYWTPDAAGDAWVACDLGRAVTFNRAMVQEFIPKGQLVEEYHWDAFDGTAWREFARGTTVGHKKLDRFADVTASKVRLTIVKSRGAPMIRELGLYRAAEK